MSSLPNAKCLVCDRVLPAHAPTCWLDRPVTDPHEVAADGYWLVNGARVYGPGPGPLRARTTWETPCQRCHVMVTGKLVLMVRHETAIGRLFYWHGSEPGTPVVTKCKTCAALAAAQAQEPARPRRARLPVLAALAMALGTVQPVRGKREKASK